ncbi:methyl-accepting chemotaxis protein [Vibrio sp. SM6]|uniref:Methyl-accepting chemotaxis protein n=1 Tax=Vibrio agarilyticus TaxID=2726741 RepID=A0A7X8YGK9_9VIBR|nr:methyl-accepting chemotaxis protein [Vibrio agarilyticus]NLS12521.1 methyl-accepting chemotaxis protein [Vibrio agarilyticus]
MTLVQRIVAGFVSIFLLLLIIAATNYSNINNMIGRIAAVADDSTPFLITAFDVQKQFLYADGLLSEHALVNEYHLLTDIKSEFLSQNEKLRSFISEFAQYNVTSQQQSYINSVDLMVADYFKSASELITLHEANVILQGKVVELNNHFLHLEDTYSSAASLLLQKSLKSRSLQNRSELVTSGINRDIKSIRRINNDTDIDELGTVLADDIREATARVKLLNIEDDVKARFLRNLNKLNELALSDDGLLPTLRQKQQTLNQFNQQKAVVQSQLNQVTQLMDSMVESAQQSAQVNADSARAEALNAKVITSIIALISAIVTPLVGFIVAVSIKRPLAKISPVIVGMSQGNMTVRTHYQSNTELGVLAKAIDLLADNTSSTLREIHDDAEKLVQESMTTSQISEKTMKQVEAQKTQTDMVATAMSEMEVSAVEISSAAESTLSEVQSTHDATSQGREVVYRNRELVENLSLEMEKAVQISNELGEYSSTIAGVLYVIRDIAEQTNLLALNAAIEAARAGEHGRGFAVVADEVRALANRTQKSTAEIQGMIENLQTSSKDIIGVMMESQERTNDCVEQTKLAEQSLQTIAEKMSLISDMSIQIAHATQEQISVSKEVAENINLIAESARQTEVEAKSSAQSSDVLFKLAQSQQTSINRFEV